MSSEPEARAVAVVERFFALLRDCRAVVPQLDAAPTDPESAITQTEPLLHFAWWARSMAGLVRTAKDALTVLRQAAARADGRGPVGHVERDR